MVAEAGHSEGVFRHMNRIDQYFDERRDEIVNMACRLIAIDTANPPGNEHLAAQVMRETLEPLGVSCSVRERSPGRTNMIARIGSGRPRILIACHFDTVPPGEGWDTDPLEGVVRGGRIYGRGATDNKGQLAVMLELGRFLKLNEANLAGEVILVGAADEERGSGLGLEWMADEGMLDADFGLIPDIGHNMRNISVAEKGALFLKIVSHGKQAHGSSPEKGVNAAWNLIDLLNEVRQMRMDDRPDPLFSPPTLSLGVLSGGNAPNVVPARCEAQLDFRFLPTQAAAEIERAVREIAARVERTTPGAKFTFEPLMMVEGMRVDPQHALVRRLEEAAEDVLGWVPQAIGMSGSTVAKPLVRCGIPAVGFGPGDEGMAHAANESIAIDELVKFGKVLGRFCAAPRAASTA